MRIKLLSAITRFSKHIKYPIIHEFEISCKNFPYEENN